ncbi:MULTISPECIES: CoA-transferase subunit beta [Vibrio]|uniref:CoA-transferase subunit beta n=1 Tax=Vibrio TaxID=662 RepID=UPI000BFFBBC9|nr:MULTISPECIES: ketoacid CoA transferase [unclassified Vibrio]PHJ41875.1 ketoacid CoA transferase [Vibrio sp. PID17_43]RIZ52984.1 ketoacid CoA transferase [Vibrio sp. PID23_8]
MTVAKDYSLAELMICAGAEAFRHDGEVLATGIGVIPRLAASLAMKTSNPDLMMTDSEAFLLSEPNPIGQRSEQFIQKNETWMGFSRIFDNVWSKKRHAMVGPTQIDQFGQANISALGSDYQRPKVQMLGVRGFPGNSICHANSFFVPDHNSRVFVSGECDMVASIGKNPARLPKGYSLDDIDLRLVITNLAVMDWQGPNNQLRVLSVHPGVSVDDVVANTGFEIFVPDVVSVTPAPTIEQLEIIRQLDPHNIRARQLKDNPPGVRVSEAAEKESVV